MAATDDELAQASKVHLTNCAGRLTGAFRAAAVRDWQSAARICRETSDELLKLADHYEKARNRRGTGNDLRGERRPGGAGR